ncbi:MAG: tetratricopeptide repeat protein [Gallionella sp.]|nr:tetratricopeptide repeat protein [Gallionella sp.]
MSVINQVLYQIEQRGAQKIPGQSMVRAVTPLRDMRKLKLVLLVLTIGLVVFALAWQWQRMKKSGATTTGNVQTKSVTIIAAPASGIIEEVPAFEALAPESTAAVSAPGQDKPLLAPYSTSPDHVAAKPSSEPGKPLSGRRGLATPSPRAVTSERPLNESGEPIQSQSVTAPVYAGEPPVKQISPMQQADAEFYKASGLAQQGHIADALAAYEGALRLNPGHDTARQALAALLLENKRTADAERVLHDGIKLRPEQTGFAMLLARMQVERGKIDDALATLEKSLPFAEQQADYQAFLAALLQRQNRHHEAILHYQIVLQISPNNGIWQMGYGISLRAVQRNAEAKDAFKRALESKTLTPELREFVQQKLKGL